MINSYALLAILRYDCISTKHCSIMKYSIETQHTHCSDYETLIKTGSIVSEVGRIQLTGTLFKAC